MIQQVLASETLNHLRLPAIVTKRCIPCQPHFALLRFRGPAIAQSGPVPSWGTSSEYRSSLTIVRRSDLGSCLREELKGTFSKVQKPGENHHRSITFRKAETQFVASMSQVQLSPLPVVAVLQGVANFKYPYNTWIQMATIGVDYGFSWSTKPS